jgi:lipopolysaccharide/colanic/teichoic acid biosynthesis glycosyltransferase
MLSGGRNAFALLFFGDIAAFSIALWLTLFLRYGALPSEELLVSHLGPFGFLFLLWAFIFYISGLYDKRAILFKSKLPNVLFRIQLFNILLAALFFFTVQELGITPKTVLVIYLLVSLGCILLWRLTLYPRVTARDAREKAALIGSGPEADELVREVNAHARYRLEFSVVKAPTELSAEEFGAFAASLEKAQVSVIVADLEDDALRPLLPHIYDLAFARRRVQLAHFYQVYEEVFDRVPLSLLRYDWFLRNISHPGVGLYGIARRIGDIAGGVLMGAVLAIALPFIWLATLIEGKGPLFIAQERIGRYGSRMKAYKLRTMTHNDSASSAWVGEGQNRVTRLGNFLRKTSLDEFPQFVNVLRGELSLIGPRNDIVGLGLRLAEAIPYYNVRYIVTPGLTGWAQINQQYEQGNISPQSIEETKTRLAYDFYYIKNRSLMLDVTIALKTLKRMLFRVSNW